MLPSGCYLTEWNIFISWSPHLEQREQDIQYVHFPVSGAQAVFPRQTRSLPVSTRFSQQHIITRNNINIYSSNTQNGPSLFIWYHVCLPGCLHLDVSIFLSVCLGNFMLLSHLSVFWFHLNLSLSTKVMSNLCTTAAVCLQEYSRSLFSQPLKICIFFPR